MNSSISTALDAYYAQERKTLAAAPDVRAVLLASGVTSVRATYDGAGDEGQLDDIRFFDNGDPCADLPVDDDTRQRVEDLLYALLACRHGGWDQGDGAFGHFQWDLVEESLEHEHNDRYTDHITSLHQGFELAVESWELP